MTPPPTLKIEYLPNSKYVLAKELHGGMGTVYKLFPISSGGGTIALKIIKGKSSIKAFDTECEAWFSVAYHPNIARPIAFGSWKSLPSIAIEWYPLTLDTLNPKSLSGYQLQSIISGVISALSFSYKAKGLIHQDIKPANILIDKSGKPRLSDFGLARCVAATIKDRIALGAGNIPKSTSRELSGTPFYMAPELWDGAVPSIKTDIFSLGVTFYQFLTKQHPYVENSSSHVLQGEMLMEPLTSSVFMLGDLGAQVVHFLSKCLSLDPQKRYQSYDEMIIDAPWIKLSNPSTEWTVAQSEIIAGSAQFFRNKGDIKKALSVLEGALDLRPKDVILIEELANLHAATGNNSEAELHYSIAYNNLKNTKGVYEGTFMPRPAFAWARSLLNSGRFSAAAAIVKDVLDWDRQLPSGIMDAKLIGAGLYAELGWYLLYQGDFDKAVIELETYSSRKSIDKFETIWLVEASWLSGSIKKNADEIAIKVIENVPDVIKNPGDLEHVWSRVILHEYVNPLIKPTLWKNNPSYIFVETRNLEDATKFAPGALLIPNGVDKQKPYIAVMDTYTTGGMHHATIQSVQKI
ncbi:MAG: protein kinase [Methylotenera sp.]|nr:protein kinase [Methylotenera sp.]MDO9389141.1 protein kinase [Methylotenera sp.]